MKTQLQIRVAFRFALRSAFVAVALAVMGCSSTPPVHLYLGFDASRSTRPHLGGYAELAVSIVEHAQPGSDSLTMYRVDAECREFHDGPVPDSAESFIPPLVNDLHDMPDRDCTYPARFWTEVARRTEADTRPVAIAYLSDGDNDDFRAASAHAIRTAAAHIAANPRVVAVAVIGAAPANFAALRRDLAPLEGRLMLVDAAEASSLSCTGSFVNKLDTARRQEETK